MSIIRIIINFFFNPLLISVSMPETRRNLLKGMAAGVGAVSMAGCGGDTDGQNQNQASGESSPDQEDSQIEYWYGFGGSLAENQQKMIDDFNDNDPPISVDATTQGGYIEVYNAVMSGITSGEIADTAQLAVDFGVEQVHDTGAMVPVEDIMSADQLNQDDLLDPLVGSYSVNDKLQGMPINSSTPILYYNKDLFGDAGLDPENPPRTFAGVTQASQQITENTDVEYGITFPAVAWFIDNWYALQGENLLNNGNGREGKATEINLDTSFGRELFGWIRELSDQGLYDFPGITAWGQANQIFTNQESAMLISSTSGVAGNKASAEEEGFEMGTEYLPSMDDARTGVCVGGASMWVYGDSSHHDTIANFAQHMASAEQQVFWHKNTGYYPVRKSAVDQLEEENWFEENPAFRSAFDQLMESERTNATQGPWMGPSREVRTRLEEAMETAVTSDTDIDSLLSSTKGEIDDILNRYSA